MPLENPKNNQPAKYSQEQLRDRFLDLGRKYADKFIDVQFDDLPVFHGLEMEGFVVNARGDLALGSAQKILSQIDGMSDESGAHQLEYISDAIPLKEGNFFALYKELTQKRALVQAACQKYGHHFVTRAIPFYLPFNTENNQNYFNAVGDYELERVYFKADDQRRGDAHYYEVMSKAGTPVTSFTDHCFCLAFVSGIHHNYSFKSIDECIKYFNAFAQISPLMCALSANGGFLNEVLDKKDYRLHIGLLREDLLNRDLSADTGLPPPLKDWNEYLNRQIQKEFIHAYSNNPSFEELFDSLREVCWSFIQLKIFPNGPGVEFRPVSAQPTTEASVALHMLATWLAIYTVKTDKVYTSWETLGLDMKEALLLGENARINFLGKKETVLNILSHLEIEILDMCSEFKEFNADEVFYVFNVIRDNLAFKQETLSNPESYIRATIDDPSAKEALARVRR